MVNCLMCGERITSTTTDTLCVPCRREKRRHIQEMVNTWDTDPYNDLVANLRKLVVEIDRRGFAAVGNAEAQNAWGWCSIEVGKLLGGE